MIQVTITTPSGEVITFNKGGRNFGYGIEIMKEVAVEGELQDWWDEAIGHYKTSDAQDKAYSKKQKNLISKCKIKTL